jgi:hypothetical protein
MANGEDDGLSINLKGPRHPRVEMQENMVYIPSYIRFFMAQHGRQVNLYPCTRCDCYLGSDWVLSTLHIGH